MLLRISENTLEHTSLFIDPKHRNFKVAHLLMAAAIKNQHEKGNYPNFVFTAVAENKTMMRFIERNGPVNGMKITDEFKSEKLLG